MATSLTVRAPTSVYVGDLHHDVSEGQLIEAFKEFPSLSSVRVCRDAVTGRSLRYGYVNFLSPQDAIDAITLKNHSTLNGKVIRVMRSNRDPITRKNGIGNVFVKNLDESVDSVKLQEIFQQFGNIVSCKLAMFDDGKSKEYGFVQFESEESANAAIEKLNGVIVGGKQMYVGKFVRKSDRATNSSEDKYTNLYMKNLDLEVDEELLKEKFSEFGKIVSLVISKDDNGTSRGFGFVNFESPDDARRAMETMNGSQLGSKVLYVARAQKKAEREQILRRQFEDQRREKILKCQASNVFVKNIADEVNEDELHDLFSRCGTIASVKVMRDVKGTSKGFGFVCFSKPEEANKAVDSLRGYMLHQKPLYVAIAQRKSERRAQLQLQYSFHLPGVVGPSVTFPGVYPGYYYPPPHGVASPFPSRPVLMPFGWGPNGFIPQPRPVFQQPHLWMARSPRQNRPYRGRGNWNQHAQAGGNAVSHVNQQQVDQVKQLPNGGHSTHSSEYVGPEESEMLSRLAAASPAEQKQILGERLYPLVNKHTLEPDVAAKITGMLLDMDNSELLLLLESPESLSAKVLKAAEVLKLSQ